jgi:hypothetical protein
MSKTLLALAAVSGVLSGCNVTVNDDDKRGPNYNVHIRELGPFVKIENQTDATLVLTDESEVDSVTAVFLDCSDTDLGDLDLKIEGDTLILLGTVSEDCRVHARRDDVESVAVLGDGDVECEHGSGSLRALDVTGNGDVFLNEVHAAGFALSVSGNGHVEIADADIGHFDLDLTGNGDAVIAGAAERMTLHMAGTADLQARDLTVVDLDAEMEGAGRAEITVTGTVEAIVGGQSRLEIFGEPEVLSFTGAGELILHDLLGGGGDEDDGDGE